MGNNISIANLEGYWSFDNDSLHDFSGNSRDLTNLTNLAFADGISGKCLSFADRSIIRAAYGAAINFSAKTAFSVSWWCNKTAAATTNALPWCFGFSAADGVYPYCLATTSDMKIRFNRAATYEEVTVLNAFDATLRHYVLTFDLATKAWILYRDGASFGNGALVNTPVMSTNRAFVIGSYNTPVATAGWIGLADEVRLYSRVLTPTEVLALYANPGQISAGESIEQALQTHLLSTIDSTAVNDALSKKIFFVTAEQGTAYPYCTYFPVSDPHNAFSYDKANSGDVRMQFNIYDHDRYAASSAARVVRENLHAFQGSMSDVTIENLTCSGVITRALPDEDNSFMATFDALVRYVDP